MEKEREREETSLLPFSSRRTNCWVKEERREKKKRGRKEREEKVLFITNPLSGAENATKKEKGGERGKEKKTPTPLTSPSLTNPCPPN